MKREKSRLAMFCRCPTGCTVARNGKRTPSMIPIKPGNHKGIKNWHGWCEICQGRVEVEANQGVIKSVQFFNNHIGGRGRSLDPSLILLVS